jgi:nitrate/nitrite-specific signal transduction histidine kinase
MRERAEKIGATFSLNSRPGYGTEILLCIIDGPPRDGQPAATDG